MFQFRDDYVYNMPPHFGGTEGDGMANLQYNDCTVIAVNYLTDEGALSQYVPDVFEITEPLVSVQYQKCMGIDWMAGGYYSLIEVATPARHLPTETDGIYVFVIWEDKTAPILGGREVTGMPKVYSEIPDFHKLGGEVTVHASHEGRVFIELELELGREFSPEELSQMTENGRINQLGWRYIPNIGKPGAALSHATLYPVDSTFFSGNTAEGKIKWTKAEYRFNPMQAHIINALADLPVLEYRECLFARTAGNLRQDLARDLG